MNRYEGYSFTDSSSDATVYEFASLGPNGHIKKIVQFNQTRDKTVYNLAFGNITNDGSIDDYTTNNNKDRDKILATIAAIVYDFTTRFPKCYIFFVGSTKERTRLYRMAISLNYEELSKTFIIWGLKEGGELEPFIKNKNYQGFLIKRQLIINLR
jgi:hypothetical protein